MVGVDKSSPYRSWLIESIIAIDNEIGLSDANKLLIMVSLDTEDKIERFKGWLKSKVENGKFCATESQIAHAVSYIGQGIYDF